MVLSSVIAYHYPPIDEFDFHKRHVAVHSPREVVAVGGVAIWRTNAHTPTRLA